MTRRWSGIARPAAWDSQTQAAWKRTSTQLTELTRAVTNRETGSQTRWLSGTGATPDIRQGAFFVVTQAGATNVTDFAGENDTKEITVLFTDGNSTLIHAGTILRLAGAANYNAPANTIMRFVNREGVWWETSRSTD